MDEWTWHLAEHDVSFGHLFSFLIVGALAMGVGGEARAQSSAAPLGRATAERSTTSSQSGSSQTAQAAEPVDATDPEHGNFAPDVAPDAEPEGEPFVDPEIWYPLDDGNKRPAPPQSAAVEDEARIDVRPGDAPPLPERKRQPVAASAPARDLPGQGRDAQGSVAGQGQGGPALPAQLSSPLNRMIGQMLIVGFGGTAPEEQWPQRLAGQLRVGLAGGVIFMEQNIKGSVQVSKMAALFQDSARGPAQDNAKDNAKSGPLPLFVAVDQEGGVVQRLAREKGFGAYPSAEELGKADDPHRAYLAYKDMADELVANGFNFNLGPVVDLNRNASSPTIAGKARSYSADPQRVIAYAKAFCFAHRDAGVLTVLKHFPGHGSAAGDSHVGLVDLTPTWTEAELEPYRLMVRDRVGDAVMIGHVYHPDFSDGKKVPASLSAMAIQKQLRGRLGYGGVVITDDLEMSAIRKNYGFDESLVRAIQAGADILLLAGGKDIGPDLAERAVAVIRQAVASGRIGEDRIRVSYEKIVTLKRKLARMEKDRLRKHQVVATGPGSPAALRSAPTHITAPGPAAAAPQPPQQGGQSPAASPAAAAQGGAGVQGAAQGGVQGGAQGGAQGQPAASPPSGGSRPPRRDRDYHRDDNFPF